MRSLNLCQRVLVVAAVLTAGVTSVVQANQPPVANAGPDRYMAASVVLDGTGSCDPDPGDSLAYSWSVVSGAVTGLTGADTPTPTISVTQTQSVQTVVLRLEVSDGTSSASDTVKVTVVPTIPSSIQMSLENAAFDPAKPTFVYFSGGNCNTGGGSWGGGEAWNSKANVISFGSYGQPYSRCGDMLIVYLSSVAPEYNQPIETCGFSTGGMPAIDSANLLNTQYADPRYVVTQVVFVDAACRDYTNSIAQFVSHPVGDKPAWVSNFYVANAGYGHFWSRAVNIYMVGNHGTAVDYYWQSVNPAIFTSPDIYNHGVVAGVFTSVLEWGKGYSIPNRADSPYYFQWIDDGGGKGHMAFYDQAHYPGAMVAPLELAGPGDGSEVPLTGTNLACGTSENAVAYDLLFACGLGTPTVVLSSSSPSFSVGVLRPSTTYHWTLQAHDALGGTYRAPVRSFTTFAGLLGDFNGDGQLDAADCAILQAANGTSWGQPGFFPAADEDNDRLVTCLDLHAWLSRYREFLNDPHAADPCGLEGLADSDADGVGDDCDLCPRTIPGVVVDDSGCPTPDIPGDLDRDGDVDQTDFGYLQVCLTGSSAGQTDPDCQRAKLDDDGDVDSADTVIFRSHYSGPFVPAH